MASTMTGPMWLSTEALVSGNVFETLRARLRPDRLAIIGAGYLLSRDPLIIRQPDVSVLSVERVHSTKQDDHFSGAPELAIEVVSRFDLEEDLQLRIDQYLQFGSKQVWVLYPKTRNLYIRRNAPTVDLLNEFQTLEGGELLPGFSVRVADLFLQ